MSVDLQNNNKDNNDNPSSWLKFPARTAISQVQIPIVDC